MRKRCLSLVCPIALALLALVDSVGCGSNEEMLGALASDGHLSKAEKLVQVYILDQATNPASVEFLKWGPHDETNGYFRCRYRMRNGQRESSVYDGWFFVRDGQVGLLLAQPRFSKTDREKLHNALKKPLLVDAVFLPMVADEKMSLLDARSRKDYLAGHIPGAVWVDVAAWSKAINAGEDEAAWSKRIGSLGIGSDTPVVVYGEANRPDAARVWWILRYWGIKNVLLLNGGWNSWLTAGSESETKVPTPTPRKPELKRQSKRLASKADLLRELKEGNVGELIDTRSRGEHCGERKTAKRNGAIPGAKHLEWSDTLDEKTGRFKSAAELTKLFTDAGIDLNKPATTYCQSGGRAAVMAFVVELMTGKPARNYYRSWSEWGNDARTPIVLPKK